MTNPKYLFLLFFFLGSFFAEAQNEERIKVLNFATSHLTNTSDAYSSYVDVNKPEVKADIGRIVAQLVEFRPTVICVEIVPEEDEATNKTYQAYLKDQTNRVNYSEEINVIAFEVGRLAGVEMVYGIDARIGFNYPKLIEMAKRQDTSREFLEESIKTVEWINAQPLLRQFEVYNSEEFKSETFNFYNFLATMQSPGNNEGAEIISDFYKRNLSMYANFSAIPLEKDDRVLIILGGTHTAYFDIFLKHNPKYKLIDATEYTDF
ncbi:DUF5694 domain-containing protein [Salegentibacter sediminis]|uniref:DUF5694 domain-containing protein n=1 Tax=Salegentibacter sediminis TaxID=1930251 RepID=UPI0009BCEA65|nr:DUF5694 domain-containing protein [Salegentibacter sediminis]